MKNLRTFFTYGYYFLWYVNPLFWTSNHLIVSLSPITFTPFSQRVFYLYIKDYPSCPFRPFLPSSIYFIFNVPGFYLLLKKRSLRFRGETLYRFSFGRSLSHPNVPNFSLNWTPSSDPPPPKSNDHRIYFPETVSKTTPGPLHWLILFKIEKERDLEKKGGG